jgi:hypothetical protein
VFDQAVGLWCDYFQVSLEQLSGWRMRGYVMRQPERFRQAGYLPDTLPPFPHGYQLRDQLWVMEQPSDYYRRHLLLHEGTHAFMVQWLGGSGPPWYREGMAELLATHRYENRKLELNVLPRSKEDVPEWGRIKLIRDAVVADRALTLADVMSLQPRQFNEVQAYAWSWAAATLLDRHPLWRDRFRALQTRVRLEPTRFNLQLAADLQPDRQQLDEAWQILLKQIDYGYDVVADRVHERALQSWQDQASVQLNCRLGWQSTGLQLDAGRSYLISAQGRYQLNREDPPWFCEAGGVTLRYYQGQPLGILMAAVRPIEGTDRELALVRPQPIGLKAPLQVKRTGVLFLRINEPAGQLLDNRGELTVHIRTLATPAGQPD